MRRHAVFSRDEFVRIHSSELDLSFDLTPNAHCTFNPARHISAVWSGFELTIVPETFAPDHRCPKPHRPGKRIVPARIEVHRANPLEVTVGRILLSPDTTVPFSSLFVYRFDLNLVTVLCSVAPMAIGLPIRNSPRTR
jgi:hypothetical protein